MNTENTQTNGRKVGKLEQLSPEQKVWLVDLASRCTLDNLVDALKKHGIVTSDSALSRFLRKHRAELMVEGGKELASSAEALAEQGKVGKLREGTLEAVRQRLYEQTLVLRSPEEARELYAALVKEEVKLRELELEARKVAALEQQVKLQGVKIQVLAHKGEKGTVKAEVMSSEAVAITTGEQREQDGDDGARVEATAAVEAASMRNVRAGKEVRVGQAGDPRLLQVLRDVNEIVNRGGPCDEKVLEIRGRLAGEVRLLERGRDSGGITNDKGQMTNDK